MTVIDNVCNATKVINCTDSVPVGNPDVTK